MTEPTSADACAAADATPGCATGPFSRLAWTAREIAGLLRRPASADDDGEVDDAR
ncbi:MAG: hypothetical protein M3137_05395 [Actinomycetota bacterium]|nr:hypothetical protein [Actinomycetota bacterium]